jgi:hypothetical protein
MHRLAEKLRALRKNQALARVAVAKARVEIEETFGEEQKGEEWDIDETSLNAIINDLEDDNSHRDVVLEQSGIDEYIVIAPNKPNSTLSINTNAWENVRILISSALDEELE